MTRIIKIIAIICIAVALFICATGWVMTRMIDRHYLDQKLTHMVSKNLGQNLQIDGPMHFSLVPWLGLSLHGVHLTDTSQKQPYLDIDEANIKLKLLPLLGGHIIFNGIQIVRPHVKLSYIDASRTTPTTRQQTSSANTHDAIAHTFSWLENSEVSLKQGSITYDDPTRPQKQLSDINLHVAHISAHSPFTIQASFDTSDIGPLDQAHYAITSLVKLKPDTISFENAHIISKTNQPVALRLNMSGDTQYNFSNDHLHLDDMQVELNANLHMQSTLDIHNLLTSPNLSGKILFLSNDLHTLLTTMGIDYHPTSPNALGKLSLSATLVNNRADWQGSLSDMKLSGYIMNILDDDKTLSANVNQLNLDHFLPIATKNAALPAQSASSAQKAYTRLPSLQGKLRAKTLIATGISFSDVSVGFDTTPSGVVINRSTAKVDKGNVTFTGNLDWKTTPIQLKVDSKGQRIPLTPILQAWTPSFETLITGSLNYRLSLQTQGLSSSQILSSLTGTTHLDLKEGNIKINPQTINDYSAPLNQIGISTHTLKKGLSFDDMVSMCKITQGQAHCDPIILNSSSLNVKGQGNVNLKAASLDLRCQLTTTKHPDKVLHLALSGPMVKPSIRLDLSAQIQGILKNQINKALHQQLNQIFAP